jgi:hypothetical protein
MAADYKLYVRYRSVYRKSRESGEGVFYKVNAYYGFLGWFRYKFRLISNYQSDYNKDLDKIKRCLTAHLQEELKIKADKRHGKDTAKKQSNKIIVCRSKLDAIEEGALDKDTNLIILNSDDPTSSNT